jgi:dihydroorotase
LSTLILTRPDDWHLHVRDGVALESVIAHSARQFGRAVIMPNLKPPVTTVDQALEYRQRILRALPAGANFSPLMTLYLTESTSATEVMKLAEHPHLHAFKLYPAGATTHSDAGVRSLERIYSLLEVMEKHGVPLCVHGEVTDPQVDIFDREQAFIQRELLPIVHRFPALRLVLEHITTREGVEFVRSAGEHIASSITAHHLLYNRNALLVGGVRPHYYCLPVLKRESHRLALLEAATSGEKRFFLGTDSAPHAQHSKENACGCAGCYTAHAALELYAEAFEQAQALDRLEQFASFNGPDFFGLPHNQDHVRLQRQEWRVPQFYSYGDERLIPLRADESMAWKFSGTA